MFVVLGINIEKVKLESLLTGLPAVLEVEWIYLVVNQFLSVSQRGSGGGGGGWI